MKKLLTSLSILIIIIAANLIFSSGCGEEAEFKIISFASNKVEANSGDNITLSWSYQEEDRLTSQKLKFLTLTFSGIREEEISLSDTQRSYSFVFQGPIDIVLAAEAEGGGDQAAVTIYQRQDFYFRMSATNTDPHYPYLGYALEISGGGGCSPPTVSLSEHVNLNFTKFFAFYDDPENHLIDDLIEILPRENMFRALSMSVEEANGFNLKEGSMYPAAVFNNPDAGFSNVILFGGKIITDGEATIYKADEGEGVARTGVTEYQRIFVAIVFRIGFTANISDYVDIQLGNLDQGLVTTANYNNLGSLTSIGTGEINWYYLGTPNGTTRGWIKGATLGYPITKIDGTITNVFVDLTNIEFYMPFLPDTYLDQFID